VPKPSFRVELTPPAQTEKDRLEREDPQKYKKLGRVLHLLQIGEHQHASLNIHPFDSKTGPNGERLNVAYVENKVAGAYRVLFCHRKGATRVIIVVYIGPHY
jgi:hypothetical protein